RDKEIYGERTRENRKRDAIWTRGNEKGTGRYESRIGKRIEQGQAEMKKGQEEMKKGQEEMKNQIQSHVENQVGEIKDHVNSCIERIEDDVQSMKRDIGDVKGEVQRKIEEVEEKVQGKIGDLEKRLCELEDRPLNFPANPELTYSRPTVKSLTFDGQTSWIVFKTQFDVTRRQKPGESLQVLAADVERLMNLAYAECPQDVREGLAVQFFVDAIRDEDTQLCTRLMDFTDLKSALSYSMKYEVSKISMHTRPIRLEDNAGKKKR
ncbi:hypothetical protein AVEN_242427-1, partial [Araneus ventricosus]